MREKGNYKHDKMAGVLNELKKVKNASEEDGN